MANAIYSFSVVDFHLVFHGVAVLNEEATRR